MKNKYLIAVGLSFLVLFGGCSTKKVFEPKKISKDWKYSKRLEHPLQEVAFHVALFEDGILISKDSNLSNHFHLEKGYRLLAYQNGYVTSATIDGRLKVENIKTSRIKKFDLKKTIATASVKDNILAVLFADNEIALYDFDTKAPLFQDMGSSPSVVDARIVPPYFMQDLVLFPTLDGKIVIVNATLKKKLNTIIVSSKQYFNNIIYFEKHDDKILAATNTMLLSLGAMKQERAKYESRNIIYDNHTLYVATKQGEILALTTNLQLIQKIKFPFAHFLGMIAKGNKLYILEKEGYLIVLDKNMKDYNIYNVYVKDGYNFITKKTFYVADKAIFIK
ncbi:hypothetical protein MNB_SM-3-1159 [hydrothermal vent metagenome]|uniref:Lipoprotein n=1 Tax=hydrothermal vent metagenome TaxID=652676 RepID=A0A1W1D518_9ZZZZ